ncbi:endoplasmic reticulum Oxidoreductin 1-domain-containing protein [Lasiosphaeria ovina]|uniref:Endoplasmic reticulum Oxidoreductin 1-domain-containing protein n=1 Tax=Lasiosphaeria ovina TaxID=92902 RepID=A0AAE0NKA3_9PEZI|nr:endoplasmic reticulum Oxidoreductin 1-domain-containing protein [Lasiosphaeria ovina]
MKSAARLFYLSVFALWSPQVQCLTQDTTQDACAISPKAIVSDACASYSTLERLNRNVKPALDELTQTTDFFSYYRLNLFNKKCPFWNDEDGMCGNIACAVETLDSEKDIPEIWRASELGKLEGPRAKHPGKTAQRERPQRPLQGKLGDNVGESCVVEYDDECDDRDYCVPEDESASSKGDYVSLLRNPERYTGYAGAGAKQVWDAVYRENCFQKSSFPHSASLGKVPTPKGPAAMDFKAVIEAAGRQQALEEQRQHNPLTPFVAKTGLEHEDECLEKRVFYRVMSGMHASISTHLCWDFLNQTTGQWQPNVGCYMARLHQFPDRISNLYFNYALLTRAIAKLGPYLAAHGDYTFCTGDADEDAATRAKVLAVTNKAASVPQIFDESLMFKNGEGPSLKEDFRNRFRNVSRLMDCVGCDKCRLWGKLQTAGYGAALKVLFEFDNSADKPDVVLPVLQRTELVALFNTYARLSGSLAAIQQFRAMVEQSEAAANFDERIKEAERINVIPDRAKKPRHVIVPPVSAPTEAAVDDEFDEFLDDDDVPEFQQNTTLKDEFNQELELVMRALRAVLRSWMSFPRTFFDIITSELLRVWQGFIGLPVQPRSWKFQRPSMDEL